MVTDYKRLHAQEHDVAEDNEVRQLQSMREMARLQARVCYMNVDRTLANWTRTALTLIIAGTAVNRYGLLLTRPHLVHQGTRLAPNPVSTVGGLALVTLGLFIVITTAIRHQVYITSWHDTYGPSPEFGPWLAFPFAVLVMLCGISLLVLLLVFTQ